MSEGAFSIDAVFFDFDGVLAESADIKTDAFRELYAPFGDAVVDKCVTYHTHHAGISRVVKIEKFHKDYLGQALSADEIEAWAARYSAIVEQKVVDVPAVPGAVEFLQSAQGNIPSFVISGTPDVELKRIVAARGWSGYFAEVHGSPRLKPVIIEDILARTGLVRDRVVFVGDAMTDSDAARDTGLKFIGRVAPGHADPFPPGTEVIADLFALPKRVAA